MAEVSTFRGVLEFFDKIGIYDVVLPFLLIFSITFAIFEKTKVLGTEEIDGKKYTKKNLNAMAAFVIAFMVIASSKLVETITEVSSNMVMLLLLVVFFLLLIGSFYKEGEGVFLEKGWKLGGMIVLLIGILAVFAQAVKMDNGEGFLEYGWRWLINNLSSTAVASIIMLVVILIFIMIIVKEPKGSKSATTEIKTEEKKIT